MLLLTSLPYFYTSSSLSLSHSPLNSLFTLKCSFSGRKSRTILDRYVQSFSHSSSKQYLVARIVRSSIYTHGLVQVVYRKSVRPGIVNYLFVYIQRLNAHIGKVLKLIMVDFYCVLLLWWWFSSLGEWSNTEISLHLCIHTFIAIHQLNCIYIPNHGFGFFFSVVQRLKQCGEYLCMCEYKRASLSQWIQTTCTFILMLQSFIWNVQRRKKHTTGNEQQKTRNKYL